MLEKRGLAVVPIDPPQEMVDAALRATAIRLNLPGSQLQVNRQKMKIRWRAMVEQCLGRKVL